MMHPELSRELSRVQQDEALRRRIRREAATISPETGATRERRGRAALSPLRLVARLQPRGH